jgi:hypothetical protein
MSLFDYDRRMKRWARRKVGEPLVRRLLQSAGFSGKSVARAVNALDRAGEYIDSRVNAGQKRLYRAITGGKPVPSTSSSSKRRRGGGGPAPPSRGGRRGGKKKYRYHTTGSSVYKYTPKFKSGMSDYAKNGATLKVEHSFDKSDPECVYVGHSTHPAHSVMRVIFMSVIRKVAKRWGQDFNDFQSVINGEAATTFNNIQVRIQYRTTVNGVLQESSITIPNQSTWMDLADIIASRIIQLAASTVVYFELYEIQFANTLGTIAQVNSVQTVRASSTRVKVHGKSHLNFQNRTVATDSGTVDESNRDDIANNPLRGKSYTGFGSNHLYKWNNDRAVSAPSLSYETVHGALELSAGDANFTPEMSNSLKKPPPYKSFGNCTGQHYVRVMPGQIVTSTINRTYEKSLNGFIFSMLPFIREATDMVTKPAVTHLKMGTNRFFGLEKLCNTASNEPDISVGCEVTLTISAIAVIKRNTYAAPSFNDSVAPAVVI